MSIPNITEEVPSLFSIPGIPTRIPDRRQPYEKQLAVHLILACLLLERTTFYILDISIVSTLTSNNTRNWNSTDATRAAYIFEGTNFIFLLVFGIISDWKLNRAKTIMLGFPLYLTGLTLFTFIANGSPCTCPAHNENPSINQLCADWVFPALILTAIGEAAVRANLMVLGGDQIQESQLTSRYFDKCVVAANLASILTTLSELYIPHVGNYLLLYITATVSLFLCALLFFIGLPYYLHVPPHESVVIKCIPVVINAFQSWWHYRQNIRHIENRNTNRLTDEEIVQVIREDERPPTFLDYAKLVYNGKFHDRIVDDVRSFRNALIITFILVLPYRIVFDQLYTTFQYQAKHMAHKKDYVPFVLLSEPIAAIVCVVIVNMFVYKYLQARNRSLTIANKFIIGMIFAFISMYTAGCVEMIRQHYCPGTLINGKKTLEHRSNLTIFTQLPQDIAIGFSQAFGLMATFEFAYFVAPRSAQSLFLSLYFCSVGVASYIDEWYTNLLSSHEINLKFRCPVDKHSWFYPTYFFILAGVLFIFIVIFTLCQMKIQMIRLNRQQMERNIFLRHISITEPDS